MAREARLLGLAAGPLHDPRSRPSPPCCAGVGGEVTRNAEGGAVASVSISRAQRVKSLRGDGSTARRRDSPRSEGEKPTLTSFPARACRFPSSNGPEGAAGPVPAPSRDRRARTSMRPEPRSAGGLDPARTSIRREPRSGRNLDAAGTSIRHGPRTAADFEPAAAHVAGPGARARRTSTRSRPAVRWRHVKRSTRVRRADDVASRSGSRSKAERESTLVPPAEPLARCRRMAANDDPTGLTAERE